MVTSEAMFGDESDVYFVWDHASVGGLNALPGNLFNHQKAPTRAAGEQAFLRDDPAFLASECNSHGDPSEKGTGDGLKMSYSLNSLKGAI